jgi:Peptidase family M28
MSPFPWAVPGCKEFNRSVHQVPPACLAPAGRTSRAGRWLATLAAVCLPLAVAAQGGPGAADPRIEVLLASISEARLHALDQRVVSFGTRNTLSQTSSATRGIGAARQWIFEELSSTSPRLQVSFDVHTIAPQGRITRETELRNVIAVLPGRSSRRIYIGAHYDSLNIGPGVQLAANARPVGEPALADPQRRTDFPVDSDAPGANDDGSGTALTMELARVFAASGIDFDATLVFVLWAGEEQGLVGSRAYVEALDPAGAPIDAVFNNDIVGNPTSGNGITDAASVRLFSAGPVDSPSRALARHVVRAASLYVPAHRVRLMAREDRFGRGSDHTSFSDAGFAAVTFRESNENFLRQHSPADTLDGVDFAYLTRNARVNAAGIATLALAPQAPVVMGGNQQPLIGRDPTGYDASLHWIPSPGATAYRVSWRDAGSTDWQHSRVVGNVAQLNLPGLSIDDHVFGVSAIGPDGNESLVRAFVPAGER